MHYPTYFALFTDCTCTNFINKYGYGNCAKRDGKFSEKYTCYVYQPSKCRDLVRSETDPEKQVSAKACLHRLNDVTNNNI